MARGRKIRPSDDAEDPPHPLRLWLLAQSEPPATVLPQQCHGHQPRGARLRTIRLRRPRGLPSLPGRKPEDAPPTITYQQLASSVFPPPLPPPPLGRRRRRQRRTPDALVYDGTPPGPRLRSTSTASTGGPRARRRRHAAGRRPARPPLLRRRLLLLLLRRRTYRDAQPGAPVVLRHPLAPSRSRM